MMAAHGNVFACNVDILLNNYGCLVLTWVLGVGFLVLFLLACERSGTWEGW